MNTTDILNGTKLRIRDLENINTVRDPLFRVMRNKEDVLRYRNHYRGTDKKVGFVGGVYDMLHDGHIKYLLECLKRCDILIVALDCDELARKRKDDPLRPFDDEEKRSSVLSWGGFAHIVTFRCVDEHPYDLIKFLEPDVLFTSKSTSDVTDTDRKNLEEWCGEVVTFEPQSPKSTTAQFARIEAVNTFRLVEKIIDFLNGILAPFRKKTVIIDLEDK